MVEKVERLLNLTVALLETRRPLTFADIRRRIAGYDHAEFESARRMFERDKDELRSLGVPVRTVEAPHTDADVGYTVDRREYELDEIDLDADEVAALAIALHITGEERARLGLAKVAALSPDPRATDEVVPARIDPGLEDLDEISTALVERRAIRFAYRSSRGELTERTIDPYGIGQRAGAWYLVGRDHDRDAQRVFRLDRLAGRPVPVGGTGAFEPPPDLDVVAAVSGPEAASVDITVAADPVVAWRLERRGSVTGEDDDGRVLITFHAADPTRLLPSLLALGEDVEVLGPPDVRAEAGERLRVLAGGER